MKLHAAIRRHYSHYLSAVALVSFDLVRILRTGRAHGKFGIIMQGAMSRESKIDRTPAGARIVQPCFSYSRKFWAPDVLNFADWSDFTSGAVAKEIQLPEPMRLCASSVIVGLLFEMKPICAGAAPERLIGPGRRIGKS